MKKKILCVEERVVLSESIINFAVKVEIESQICR